MTKITDWLNSEFLKWQTGQGRRKTLTQFSEYLGIHPAVVSHYLNGTRTPSGENVEKIAEALGDEIYAILDIQPPDPKLRLIKRLWDTLTDEQRTQLTHQAENYAGQKAPKSP